MRAKAMDPSGNAHTTKRLAPSNGIGLSAGLDRQCVGALGASPDDFIYLFLKVDERLLHGQARVGRGVAGCKRRDARREVIWAALHLKGWRHGFTANR